MTVSIRINGMLVHVSNIPPADARPDKPNAAVLRSLRLDPVYIHKLRTLLIDELGGVIRRMNDFLVVEETAKRVESGKWVLVIVNAPKILMEGNESGGPGAGGKAKKGSGTKDPKSSKKDDPLQSTKKTWAQFELLDKNNRPVKGLAFELTLPDGTVEKGTLSDKGSFRKDGIDPGTCKLRFPDLDGREWAKSSSFASGSAVSLFKGAPKIPAGPYTVVQGDYIASIAADAGFLSYKTVWDDGKNAALKAKRNPNVLFPGDKVEIPAKQKKEENVPTTEYSTFQTIGDPVQLKFVVVDWAGNPVAGTPLDVELDGKEQLVTAGDGSATKKTVEPQGSKTGKLTIMGHALEIRLGHLDPVEEVSGQLWRLNNLGYRAGTKADPADPIFKSAVEEFQCDHSLTVDGDCGPNTQGKLKDVHGS